MPSRTWHSIIYMNIKKTDARNLIIPLSFILPIFALYLSDPITFQYVWKGRALYLFFLWLLFLELTIAWKKLLQMTFKTLNYARILAVATTAAIPIAYVICTSICGLNRQIVDIGKLLGVPSRLGLEWFLKYSWPLSLEYLTFTISLMASIWLIYGIGGLKRFSVSLFFLGATTFFYMIDTFYPYGAFTALQSLVPTTASSASYILNWMGYETRLFQIGDGVQLWASGGGFWLGFVIFWPSSGIHSLFIYTFVILLFIKSIPSFLIQRRTVSDAVPKRLRVIVKTDRISFLLERKIIRTVTKAAGVSFVNVLRMMPIYAIVAVGAIGTFFVNVLRIVTIYTIGLNTKSEAVSRMFHDYYGELYFITWILTYLIAIGYGRRIWIKLSTLKVKLAEIRQKQKTVANHHFR